MYFLGYFPFEAPVSSFSTQETEDNDSGGGSSNRIAITPAATAAAIKKEDLSGCFSVNIINSNICVFLHTVLRGDYDLDFSPLLHILPAEEEEEEAFRFFKTIQPSAIAATTAATITR